MGYAHIIQKGFYLVDNIWVTRRKINSNILLYLYLPTEVANDTMEYEFVNLRNNSVLEKSDDNLINSMRKIVTVEDLNSEYSFVPTKTQNNL